MVTSTKEQPICPRCGSKQILYQSKVNGYLCRRCGEKFGKDTQGNVE